MTFPTADVWPELADAAALNPFRAGAPVGAGAPCVVFQVSAGVAAVRATPQDDGELTTQARYGERLSVFFEADGWGWAQSLRDGYVGWIDMEALSAPPDVPTHRVGALRTYLFSAPNLKSAPICLLSLGAEVCASPAENGFLGLSRGGFVHARHLAPLDAHVPDWVAVAESFVGGPYLWGGLESLGLDCSGLVAVALEAAGVLAPRDAGLQERTLGALVEGGADAALQRGDLIFWPGHVAIMINPTQMVHANAHHMAVAIEPLSVARSRIKAAGVGDVRCVRRLTSDRLPARPASV